VNHERLAAHKSKHLLSHVLVAAGARRWPQVARGESGETATGFYADFAVDEALGDADLASLGDDMARLLGEFKSFRGIRTSTEKARRIFAGQPWKQHVVSVLAEGAPSVGLFELEGVIDLCDCELKQAHELRAIHPEKFVLTGSAPVAWVYRGRTTWFTRIYGELFPVPPPCRCCVS
jgi:threonyl-tRNA synthetase